MKFCFTSGRVVRRFALVFSSLMVVPLLCIAQADSTQRPSLGDPMSPPAFAAPDNSGAGNLAKLLDHLNLAPEQMSLWNTYRARVEAYTRLYYEEKPASAYVGDSGARQVGRLVDILQNRLAALEDVESAARALYAGLNPQQRKLADTSLLDSVPVFNTLGVNSCPTTAVGAGGARKDGGRGPGGVGMGGMSGNMGGPGGL